MDTEEMEIKEVCALFGRAVYLIQSFERQLAITLSSVCLLNPDSVTRDQYDALLSRNFKKTLGHLFHNMKEDVHIPAEVKEEIEAALRMRNFPIHNYFWERMMQFRNSAGREAMLHELSDACTVFEKVDSKLEAITKEWGKKRGVPEQDYAEALVRLLKAEDY